jgi:regulatory protein
MRIVSIEETGPKRRARCIHFDDGYELTTSGSVATALGLKVGFVCELSTESFYGLVGETAVQYARKRSYDLVAKRDYTTHELRQRLDWDGYDKDLIDELIKHLESLGLADDRRYAAQYCSTRLRAHYGPYAIVQKLAQKGIPPEVSEAAIALFIQDEDFDMKRSAQTCISKYDMRDNKERQRAFRKLISRGFDYDTAKYAITIGEDLAS